MPKDLVIGTRVVIYSHLCSDRSALTIVLVFLKAKYFTKDESITVNRFVFVPPSGQYFPNLKRTKTAGIHSEQFCSQPFTIEWRLNFYLNRSLAILKLKVKCKFISLFWRSGFGNLDNSKIGLLLCI